MSKTGREGAMAAGGGRVRTVPAPRRKGRGGDLWRPRAEPALRISLADARRLVLHAQGLDGSWRLPRGAEAAAEVVMRLGYVQIDTITVIERAHHHTLWTRQSDHRPEHLDRLQRIDRQVFQYWDHAACIVPMANYRFYLPSMRACGAPGTWSRRVLDRRAALVEQVLARVRDEGALGGSDFARPDNHQRTGWGDWTPAKEVLSALYNTGRLMVSHRESFELRYDLPERVLPAGIDTREPDRDERARFWLDRALRADGFAIERGLLRRDDGTMARVMAERAGDGRLRGCTIEGMDEPCVVDPAVLATALRPRRRSRPIVHILSPFDNGVIDRRRLRALFGFDYTLECYVPAARRRYGYFCLPILLDDRFVARLDAKAERKDGVLRIRSMHVEAGCRDIGDHLESIAGRLRDFAAFNGCRELVLERAVPAAACGFLRRAMEHAAPTRPSP